tara:strand:- start:560 stop:886 length:327 start_codon:yes stop_codon:yes gene_type:complete
MNLRKDSKETYTLQLTRRELGLLLYQSSIWYHRVDSDLELGHTGYDHHLWDWFGKDAVVGLFRRVRTLVDSTFDNDKQLERVDAFTRPFCYEPKSQNHYTKWDVGQFD